MGTFVAVYVRGSGAAAWLMRVPLGGPWVACRHGWLACRVWLNFNLNNNNNKREATRNYSCQSTSVIHDIWIHQSRPSSSIIGGEIPGSHM